MAKQSKCIEPGCEKTVIPGRSPTGRCLKHEKEFEKKTPKVRCVVKGCGRTMPLPFDKVPMCQDCRDLANKIWWIMQFTKPLAEKKVGGIILPGQQKLPPVEELMKKAKGGSQ